MSRLALAAVLLGLAACARPPRNLVGEFAPVTVADAQRQPRDGVAVRWGGTLVETIPERDRTCFQVVARRLDRQARPEASDEAGGRFVACAPGFYEPTVFAPGRDITVIGALHGERTSKVGEYDYRFPLVDAATVHLWPERPPPGPVWSPGLGISIGGVYGGW